MTCAKCDVRPPVQAAFRVLVRVPGEWTEEEMEKLTGVVIAAVNSTPATTIEARWSSTGLTRTTVPEAQAETMGRILPFPAHVEAGA